MKAYVAITGTLFGLITLAHILRVVDEGTKLLRQPWWVLVTLLAAVMSVWAFRLLWRRSPR